MNGDNNLTSDKIAVVFDTFRDKNGRSWFELNPDGVKGDHQNGDPSYDPVWQGATKIDSLGWTAEFRIPPSQLGFSREINLGYADLENDRSVQRIRHVGVLAEQRVRRTRVLRHSREGFDQFGDFNFSRDRSALFRDMPTNVFQVKATYWIGR